MQKDWPARTIRMPDELWFAVVKKAADHKMSTAEYIRIIIEKDVSAF